MQSIEEGVFIKIFWDIERECKNGRRARIRTTESIWFLAEIMKVEYDGGRMKAHLRYEAMDGFAEQSDEVWMFPKFIRSIKESVEGSVIQLRWRFYECSGNVEENYDTDSSSRDCITGTETSSGTNERLCLLEQVVTNLSEKCEGLEGLVVAQSQLHSRLLGDGSSGERRCARLFSSLRQKVALLMQRPIPAWKAKKEREDDETFYEECTVGSLRTEIDCCMKDFEVLGRVIKAKASQATFKPDLSDLHFPLETIESAEVRFGSLSALCHVIGLSALSDLLYIARREKSSQKRIGKAQGDVVLRLMGTYLLDTEAESSTRPVAFLICNALQQNRLDENVTALVRRKPLF